MSYANSFRHGVADATTTGGQADGGMRRGDSGGDPGVPRTPGLGGATIPRPGGTGGTEAAAGDAPRAHPRSSRGDWERAGLIGAGVLLGIVAGATVALLTAPQSGAATRAFLARRARRLRHRGGDVWDDLADELRWAARRSGKRSRRALTRAGWAADDTVDRVRRRVGR